MKKYTKKFLNKVVKGKTSWDKTVKNSEGAKRELGIPKKLYIELSENIAEKNLFRSIIELEDFESTLFIAGFVIGWAEKNKNIK